MTNQKSKILLLDLETSPNICYTWGVHEVDAIKVIKPWIILSFAYQWLGEKTHVFGNIDFGDPLNDKPLCKKLHWLLDMADVVIAQNGDAFDIPKINTRFEIHRLGPPSPYRTIDTVKIARSVFAFNSNKLDNVGKDLSEGEKIKHRGFEMWEGCMAGKIKDWDDMKRYNKGDVDLLKRIYLRFRPWIKNHPNMSVFSDGNVCPNCASPNINYRGYAVTNTSRYKRFQCQSCGHWGRDKEVDKKLSAVTHA